MTNKKIGYKRKIEVHAIDHIPMSAHKARRVIDQIRGRSYEKAVLMLSFMPYHVSGPILELVRSAGANASYTRRYNKTDLIICKAEVNKGITGKKWKPRGRGRSYSIKRPTCIISVTLCRLHKKLDNFARFKKSRCKNKDTNTIYNNIYSSGRGVWDKK